MKRFLIPLIVLALFATACGGGDDQGESPRSTISIAALRYNCVLTTDEGEEVPYFWCVTRQERQLLPEQVEVEIRYSPDALTDLGRRDIAAILETLERAEFVPIDSRLTQSQFRTRAVDLGFAASDIDQAFRVATAPRACRPDLVWRIPVCRR